MRWSQWMVLGTMVLGRPDEINCKTAICAVASCIATRSVHAVLKYCAYYKCHTRPEHEVALATDDFLVLGVIEVAIDDLLMVMHTPEPLLDALPFQKTSGAC